MNIWFISSLSLSLSLSTHTHTHTHTHTVSRIVLVGMISSKLDTCYLSCMRWSYIMYAWHTRDMSRITFVGSGITTDCYVTRHKWRCCHCQTTSSASSAASRLHLSLLDIYEALSYDSKQRCAASTVTGGWDACLVCVAHRVRHNCRTGGRRRDKASSTSSSPSPTGML